MLPLDYQAEIMLSFQKERQQQYQAQMAAQAAAPRKEARGSRLLRSSGTLLIRIGSRLQGWSGVEAVGPAADLTSEMGWR